MGRLHFEQNNFTEARNYLEQYHLTGNRTAISLWLAIRTDLELNSSSNVDELAANLASDFPDSEEYQSWLDLQ